MQALEYTSPMLAIETSQKLINHLSLHLKLINRLQFRTLEVTITIAIDKHSKYIIDI